MFLNWLNKRKQTSDKHVKLQAMTFMCAIFVQEIGLTEKQMEDVAKELNGGLHYFIQSKLL